MHASSYVPKLTLLHFRFRNAINRARYYYNFCFTVLMFEQSIMIQRHVEHARHLLMLMFPFPIFFKAILERFGITTFTMKKNSKLIDKTYRSPTTAPSSETFVTLAQVEIYHLKIVSRTLRHFNSPHTPSE